MRRRRERRRLQDRVDELEGVVADLEDTVASIEDGLHRVGEMTGEPGLAALGAAARRAQRLRVIDGGG